MVPLFGAAYASPNKGTTFYTDLGLQKHSWILRTVNGKIQELFNAFECFSSTFQGKLIFQGLFTTVLYIQVLFKPVGSLLKSSFWSEPNVLPFFLYASSEDSSRPCNSPMWWIPKSHALAHILKVVQGQNVQIIMFFRECHKIVLT